MHNKVTFYSNYTGLDKQYISNVQRKGFLLLFKL